MIVGDADAELGGETGKPGRQIVATTIDIALAPDGTTPVALLGAQNVLLTFPRSPKRPAGRFRHTLTRKASRAKG